MYVHQSILPSVLQAITRMDVGAAEDGEMLEPNPVYVIPPDKHLIVINGHLRLSALEPEHGKRVAVDLFFRSLADVRISDFMTDGFFSSIRAGETVAIRDTETDPHIHAAAFRAIKLRAAPGVPSNHDGEMQFVLAIADSRPRDRQEDEIELFRELANRFFPRLQRAHAEEALRVGEERLEAIANLVPDLLWISDPVGLMTWYNQR